jgi:uncharacterized protein
MIRRSFIFLEKVGKKKEKNIWSQGIPAWHDFLQAEKVKGISAINKYCYDRKIQEAQHALQEDNAAYYVGKLPQIEMWRMYEFFKEECCFLDIEVDGSGRVVIVGISHYFQTNTFVAGVNLEKSLLEKELMKYKIMVTFNGSPFDLPKLKKEFGLTFALPHIDLKPLCVNLGWKGGLKEVERILSLRRPRHLLGNPITLWKAFHASGDREYLDLLIAYNNEDCENLKGVMERAYKELSNKIYKHSR